MKPIRFKPLSRGGFRGMAFGFKGNIFPLVCRVYVDAMCGGKLRAPQLPIAERCKVVLNALQIDEATGYQDVKPISLAGLAAQPSAAGQAAPYNSTPSHKEIPHQTAPGQIDACPTAARQRAPTGTHPTDQPACT